MSAGMLTGRPEEEMSGSRGDLLQELSQELEQCWTQLNAATAELKEFKKASPGNIPLQRENILICPEY